MSGVLYLATRCLAYHRWRTALLVSALALIFYVPSALHVLVAQSERTLTARAEATPLLVGARGSPLELTLRALYLSGDVPKPLPYSEVGRIAGSGYADAIPLHVRFRAGEHPVVGTSVDYFGYRGLRVSEGALLARLGDCVLVVSALIAAILTGVTAWYGAGALRAFLI